MRARTTTNHIMTLAWLLMMGLSGPVQAQTSDTVRVAHSCITRLNSCRADRGTVNSLTTERVLLHTNHGVLEIPRQRVAKVELHVGRSSNPAAGAIAGFFVGGAAGAAHFVRLCERDDCELRTGQVVGLGALIGGLGGAGLGAIIGLAIKTDRWEEIPVESVPVAWHRFEGGRVGAGLSVAF